MASPAPSALSAEAPPTKAQEQITFRFCRECSNMLYPKEDRMTNKLMFACRTCQFSEEAISSCVFRNNMYNTVGETAGVTQDVGSDPTLPRSNKECPSCREPEAVFFQSQQRSAETGMKLFYVCCSCGTIFQ
ncbi:DNA-directed RNA polymerase-like protein II subunit rpb9 [Usnea florida]